VEVLPWEQDIPWWGTDEKTAPSWVGKKGGWVIVPYLPPPPAVRAAAGARPALPSEAQAPTADEIIAYLPPLEASDVGGSASLLGQALGRALVQWASYLRVRNRQNTDPTLAGLIEVAVRVAPKDALTTDPALLKRRTRDAAGVHDVDDGEAVWIELHVKKASRDRLYTGILVCSDDGNILLTWPPNGSSPAMGAIGEGEGGFLTTSTETVFVGLDRFNPAFPQPRTDQSSSRYTFKIVAYTSPDGEPLRLASLAQDDTVQDVIVRALAPSQRGLRPLRRVPPAPTTPLWCTWDLVVRVNRR
jgi:hypothetical protein